MALSNGVIRNFPLLATLNRALRITGGNDTDTRFERLSATLDLNGGVMRTRNASLRAGELTALAAGALGFDRYDRHDRHGRVLAPGERAADRERQRDFGGQQ